jgi:glycine hydroxymethyltransferase
MLKQKDPQIYELIKLEEKRQKEVLEMIPSENYASKEVLEALGTVLNNKYSEGYPHRRYYQGNVVIDEVEILAEERAKILFEVPYVNVQALSGSAMNLAVYFATLKPLAGKIMGLALAFGGHLTHGQPQSASGQFFKSTLYTLNKEGKLDFDAIEKQALAEKPDMIVCGFTAYPGVINFKRFGEIADKIGAYLLADISHIAGLIAAGVHPSPVPYAHIVTTTTHKTLRGPRGALIMVTQKGLDKDPELPRKIDTAIIPGLQGGPHDNQTAAIAVALKEAATLSFKKYGEQIVKNSKTLAKELIKYGFNLVGGGSDNHLILIDLSNKKVNGAVAALALECSGIIVNKNGVPNDPMPPFYPTGIRLGVPAITTRGMKTQEMVSVARWINEAILECQAYQLPKDKEMRKEAFKKIKLQISENKTFKNIFKEVKALTVKFPLP